MNAIHSIMRLHTKNKYAWFITPWIAVLSSFIVGLFISLLLGGNKAIYFGGVFSIYIFAFVQGIVTLNDTFAFALGLSARRVDYFLGTALLALILNAAIAFCLVLLAFIERSVIVGWGASLHFFALIYVNDGSLGEQLWVSFALLIHMYFLGFGFGSVYLRFGKSGMWVSLVLVCVFLSGFAFISTYLRWWYVFASWLRHFTAFEVSLWLVPLIVIYMLIALLFLRKSVV